VVRQFDVPVAAVSRTRTRTSRVSLPVWKIHDGKASRGRRKGTNLKAVLISKGRCRWANDVGKKS